MKRNYTLVFMLLCLLLSVQLHAKVIQVAAPADISTYVVAAADGDTIELTTAGGAYTWSSPITKTSNDTVFTIRAKAGLSSKPVVTSSGTAAYFLRLSSYDSTQSFKWLRFEGINFDGYNPSTGVYSAIFYYSYLNSTTYCGINMEIKNCIFTNFKQVLYYSASISSGTGSNNAGNISISNTEFRKIRTSVFYCPATATAAPNTMIFSNCLFYNYSTITSTIPCISMQRATIKSYLIDHCTFINSYGSELNIAATTGPSIIQNSIFSNKINSSYSNIYSAYLSSDCGIYYTAGGYQGSIYPNSGSARIDDPKLDSITGVATSSAYLTGSTDGKPIGYYKNVNQITSSTTQLTGFDYTGSIGPSAVQQFVVSAVGLSNNLVITPPANFEISPLAGIGFSSSPITISPSGGAVSATTIYVRLKSGLADNTYTGNLTIASAGSASQTVSLSGTVTNKPTLYGSPAVLSGLTYTLGSGPSTEKSFTISAINLTSSVTVTSPANYEISPLSGAAFFPMSSISIAQSGGKINPITIYVRLKSGLAVNTYSGNINIASAGATARSVALSGSVTNIPALITSVTGISNLYGFYDINSSVVKTFSLTGTDLKDSIKLAVPYPFEASIDGVNYAFGKTLTVPMSTSYTVYVRLNAHLYPGTDYAANMTISSTGATNKIVALSGRSMNQPTISISATSFTGMDYFKNSGPSTIKSFTVSGTYLIDNVVITPSSNYEISTTGGGAFSAKSSISLIPTSYSLNNQTIYVRLKSGLNSATYAENISCTSSYASSKNVSFSGTVTSQPTITSSTLSLSGMNYNLGYGPSSEQSFTVGGEALSSIILVSSPADFEISTSSGSAFSPSSYILISQSGGTASPTTIYVRLKAGLAANNYSETIGLISTGVTTQNITCSGTVIVPVSLTINMSGSGTVKDNNTLLSNGSVLTVDKGSVKTFTITPASNYLIYSIKLNGVDVKSQLINNQYTTAAINATSTLSVVFTFTSAIDPTTENTEKVYGADSKITVEGADTNEDVYIFDSKGILVKVLKITGDKVSVQLRNNTLYFVKTKVKTYKVIL